ncbi:unnamed protein product [Ixodes persulcatus]
MNQHKRSDHRGFPRNKNWGVVSEFPGLWEFSTRRQILFSFTSLFFCCFLRVDTDARIVHDRDSGTLHATLQFKHLTKNA